MTLPRFCDEHVGTFTRGCAPCLEVARKHAVVVPPVDPDVVRKRDSAYLDRQDTYDTHVREEPDA